MSADSLSDHASAPRPDHAFLVTCVGAYDDSGIGTGGLVCLHEGRATVIDKIDSTGLCFSEGVAYRFARGLGAILGYSSTGLKFVLKVPEARDVHDLVLRDGLFVCVATGANEILWIDPLGRIARRWRAEGERDAWHLNCLCEVEGRLHVSAFGRFSAHRGWVGKCAGTGFVYDLEREQDSLTGVNGPHHPRMIDGEWVICDSHSSALVFQRPGEEPRRLQLGGFTRGLAHDGSFLYVGESANRKAAEPVETSAIAIVDRRSHEVVKRVPVPFPEIYDVLPIPAKMAAAMAERPELFRLDASDVRIERLEEQVEIGRREAETLRIRIEGLRMVESLMHRVITVKRKLFG